MKLNETTIGALAVPERGNRLFFFPGATVQGIAVPRGFAVRVTADGARSFVLDYRAAGRQRRLTIGRWPDWSALRAVREGRELRQRVDRGEDPLAERKEARKPAPEPEPVKTLGAVLDEFLAAHVDKKLRGNTARSYHYTLEKLVKPAIGHLPIYNVRRSHIATLLDAIEDENGTGQADSALVALSSALNWYMGRDDDFAAPRLKGLKRSTGRSRDRVLSDAEIRAIWQAASDGGTYGAAVRLLLLTGQRRQDVEGMRRAELLEEGLWVIPAGRYKTGREHAIPLSRAALAIVEEREGDPLFPGPSGGKLFDGGQPKARFDRLVTAANDGAPLAPWTLHDLRRTARTLMERAGVRPDIAERVLGHAIRGVEATYNRYSYSAEKRDALERLARLTAEILDPEAAQRGKVVPLRA